MRRNPALSGDGPGATSGTRTKPRVSHKLVKFPGPACLDVVEPPGWTSSMGWRGKWPVCLGLQFCVTVFINVLALASLTRFRKYQSLKDGSDRYFYTAKAGSNPMTCGYSPTGEPLLNGTIGSHFLLALLSCPLYIILRTYQGRFNSLIGLVSFSQYRHDSGQISICPRKLSVLCTVWLSFPALRLASSFRLCANREISTAPIGNKAKPLGVAFLISFIFSVSFAVYIVITPTAVFLTRFLRPSRFKSLYETVLRYWEIGTDCVIKSSLVLIGVGFILLEISYVGNSKQVWVELYGVNVLCFLDLIISAGFDILLLIRWKSVIVVHDGNNDFVGAYASDDVASQLSSLRSTRKSMDVGMGLDANNTLVFLNESSVSRTTVLTRRGVGSGPVAFTAVRNIVAWPEEIKFNFEGAKVVRRLGGGGFGAVVLCSHLGLDYAVKIIDPCVNGVDSLRAMERELQALHRVRAPCCVTFYGVAELPVAEVANTVGFDPSLAANDSCVYGIVMSFVRGRTLKDWLADRSFVTLIDFCDIAVKIVNAVAVVHSRSVVHKDLKPENIMLELRSHGISARRETVTTAAAAAAAFRSAARASRGDNGAPAPAPATASGPPALRCSTTDLQVVLIDFGISGAVGELIGATRAFAAPEVLRGDLAAVGAPVDAYAMGVILFELVFGRLPVRQGEFNTKCESIPPASWQELLGASAAAMPAAVWMLLRGLLVDQPTQRLSVRAMVQNLAMIQSDEGAMKVVCWRRSAPVSRPAVVSSSTSTSSESDCGKASCADDNAGATVPTQVMQRVPSWSSSSSSIAEGRSSRKDKAKRSATSGGGRGVDGGGGGGSGGGGGGSGGGGGGGGGDDDERTVAFVSPAKGTRDDADDERTVAFFANPAAPGASLAPSPVDRQSSVALAATSSSSSSSSS